jgi:hypothetical protein
VEILITFVTFFEQINFVSFEEELAEVSRRLRKRELLMVYVNGYVGGKIIN